METNEKPPQIPMDVFYLLLEFADKQKEAGIEVTLASDSIPADDTDHKVATGKNDSTAHIKQQQAAG